MGREVAKLFDGFMGAGYHEIVWEAEGLGSGVYFVRLMVDGEGSTAAKRVVLTK